MYLWRIRNRQLQYVRLERHYGRPVEFLGIGSRIRLFFLAFPLSRFAGPLYKRINLRLD